MSYTSSTLGFASVMPTTRRSALIVAWIGAGLFAWSLGWFLYCYLIRLDDPRPPTPSLSHSSSTSFFFRRSRSPQRPGEKRNQADDPARGPRRPRAIALHLDCQPALPGCLHLVETGAWSNDQLDGGWRAAAWAIQALAVVLTLRASSALDILDLAGVRDVQRSKGDWPVERDPPQLTTRGLYGIVRHPLYFAWSLFVFASPTMTGTRAAFAVINTRLSRGRYPMGRTRPHRNVWARVRVIPAPGPGADHSMGLLT